MPYFCCDGAKFYYELVGIGPVVVFTHGLSGDLEQCRELIGELRNNSLLLWDARGHGRTVSLDHTEPFSFAQFARDLHALLSYLGITRAVFGGVSMGAGVAARVAIDWPSLAAGLILVRPAWLDHGSPEALLPYELIAGFLEKYGSTDGRRHFEQTTEYAAMLRSDPVACASFCEQFGKVQAVERAGRLREMPQSCPIRHWEEVDTLEIASLVVGCEADFVHPFSYAIEWANRLRRSQLVQVPPKSAGTSRHNQAVQSAVTYFLGSLTQHRMEESRSVTVRTE